MLDAGLDGLGVVVAVVAVHELRAVFEGGERAISTALHTDEFAKVGVVAKLVARNAVLAALTSGVDAGGTEVDALLDVRNVVGRAHHHVQEVPRGGFRAVVFQVPGAGCAVGVADQVALGGRIVLDEVVETL